MEQREQQTEQQIVVREVTHVQVSWTEVERGAPGESRCSRLRIIGAEEYLLNPTVDDVEAILRFRDRSGRMYFDLQRHKVFMFGNMPVGPSSVVGSLLEQLQ
jgi:hypothetical protein